MNAPWASLSMPPEHAHTARLEYNGNVKSEDLEVLTAVNVAKRASVISILRNDQQVSIDFC